METGELNPTTSAIQPRLRLAGVLIVLALLIELFSLFWNRPIAFLVFMFGGGVLLAAGILIYLYSLVSLPIHRKKS